MQALGNYPQAKRDIAGGVTGLEGRIEMMDQEIAGIMENLMQLQSRLYPARPSPVQPINDGSVAGSIENGMNRVITHLQELRRVSNEILHG